MTMATCLLLLVLGVSALFSSSADVFESIDCGSSEHSYTDSNGIKWKGDSDLIKNGVAQVVQSTNSTTKVLSTLRVFRSRRKNCYNISVDKGGKILVRAIFFYGNYDLKSFPPSFDLHFDGNFWSTVVTSSTEVVSHEVIYVPKGDTISVCVAQTKPNNLPFISTLVVRSLGSLMYSGIGADYALMTRIRMAYGTNLKVRYPEDKYDRIWVPLITPTGYRKVVSSALAINTTNIADDPPQAVLHSAITTTGANYIPLSMSFLAPNTPIYLIMYFSEVTRLNSTQKRSFTIFKDTQVFSNPVVPTYGSVTEMYAPNTTASWDTIFSLVATNDSTLPPLINAAEVFAISDKLTDGTNSNDVKGLAALQYGISGFEILQEWRGDPCLPISFSWEWINCTSDTIPRVTALNLNSFALEGSLPDFSSMNALESIDLSNNSLSGKIPAFLGTLPNLKELNLADNKFSGDIPASITNNTKLKLTLKGNSGLCTSEKSCGASGTGTPIAGGSPSTKKGSNNLVLILGVVIGCLGWWIIV